MDSAPGVQRRYLDATTIFRVTTREQTLLDTILYPVQCGGPAVVFEAWDTGLETLDEPRLLSYLDAIGDLRLDLKIGYILEQRDFEAGPELSARIDAARRFMTESKDPLPIPLLRGYHFSRTDKLGLLGVP